MNYTTTQEGNYQIILKDTQADKIGTKGFLTKSTAKQYAFGSLGFLTAQFATIATAAATAHKCIIITSNCNGFYVTPKLIYSNGFCAKYILMVYAFNDCTQTNDCFDTTMLLLKSGSKPIENYVNFIPQNRKVFPLIKTQYNANIHTLNGEPIEYNKIAFVG